MKIITVEYRRLRNLGNYENETVGATAEVQDGETPEEALEKLKVFVAEQLLAKQREIEFDEALKAEQGKQNARDEVMRRTKVRLERKERQRQFEQESAMAQKKTMDRAKEFAKFQEQPSLHEQLAKAMHDEQQKADSEIPF